MTANMADSKVIRVRQVGVAAGFEFATEMEGIALSEGTCGGVQPPCAASAMHINGTKWLSGSRKRRILVSRKFFFVYIEGDT